MILTMVLFKLKSSKTSKSWLVAIDIYVFHTKSHQQKCLLNIEYHATKPSLWPSPLFSSGHKNIEVYNPIKSLIRGTCLSKLNYRAYFHISVVSDVVTEVVSEIFVAWQVLRIWKSTGDWKSMLWFDIGLKW